MNKIAIFMADGVEEIEGLAVVDLLRRAGKVIDMISITDKTDINGSHGIIFKADKLAKDTDFNEYDMIVLPGGGVGTQNLKASAKVKEVVMDAVAKDKYIAAICAAPTVFASYGLLEGRNACCYETCEPDMAGAVVNRNEVTVDGKIITSRGMGTAIAFGLKLVEMFDGQDEAKKLGNAIMYRK